MILSKKISPLHIKLQVFQTKYICKNERPFLNPTYMDTMSISGIFVTFWFDKNIFILHKTGFFSFFILLFFIIFVDCFWLNIFPRLSEFLVGDFFVWYPTVSLDGIKIHVNQDDVPHRVNSPIRNDQNRSFLVNLLEYEKMKISEKNSVKRKMDLSNQKITKRSEINICSCMYGPRNYCSFFKYSLFEMRTVFNLECWLYMEFIAV